MLGGTQLLLSGFPLTWLALVAILWPQDSLCQVTTVDTSIQNDPHFIGWYIGPSGTEPLTDPDFWTTSGQYAVGCTASPCTWATACTANTITYNNGDIQPCGSARCITMTIFEQSPYATPSASNIFCAQNWGANTVYRELPATTTSSGSTSSATSSGTAVPITSSPAPTSTSETSTTSGATSVTTPTESLSASAATPSGENRAWIAGPVIGAVAGVGIIVAATIWFVLYTKKRTAQTEQTQAALPYHVASQRESLKEPQEMYQENPSAISRPSVYELS